MKFVLSVGNIQAGTFGEDEIAEIIHERLEGMSPGDQFTVRAVRGESAPFEGDAEHAALMARSLAAKVSPEEWHQMGGAGK
jgi:hypothetical protein